jgi:hypothetical protein
MAYKRVLAVYPDGSTRNITDEFNYTLHCWEYSFFELVDSVTKTMKAETLQFER